MNVPANSSYNGLKEFSDLIGEMARACGLAAAAGAFLGAFVDHTLIMRNTWLGVALIAAAVVQALVSITRYILLLSKQVGNRGYFFLCVFALPLVLSICVILKVAFKSAGG